MPIFGTIVIDDSSNKVITGTQAWDRDGGGVFVGPSGTAFPGTPTAGEMFWREDEAKLYRRNDANTTWEAITSAVSLHASTHVTGGTDVIANAVPAGNAGLMTGADKTKLDGVATGATNTPLTATSPADVTKAAAAAGVSTSAARADHKHDIATATPSTIGTANTEGASTSLARADHVHSHGNQAGGALHADVIAAGASGFMTGADKTKLNGIASGATSTPLTAAAPADVTKAAAAVGVSTDAARADHKHDVTTAVPVGIGTANAEGAATSLARSNHVHDHGSQSVGTHHAAVIAAGASGFMTGADKTKLDGIEAGAQVVTFTRVQTALNAASGTVGINNQLLANVATPVAATDAANKAYVDAAVTGLDVKASCRIATTADVGLTGLAAIDGVTPVGGDRILVKNQSTASQNGIYVAAAGAWSRSTDADASAEVTSGLFTFVTEGTTQADTGWLLTTNDPITLGTTALTFAQFTGGGASLAVTAPVSVDKSANSVGVGTTAARADHKHDVSTAAAVTLSTANAEGAATSLARSDHTHDHGSQSVGTHHAAVIAGGTSGFMTGTDKTKLDGIAASAAALTAVAPVDVTKAAAAVGVATLAARADHKHDVTTAAPATGIGAANSEGAATTLARSDHNHTLRESGGTNLTLGAVADGEFLKRVGTAVVGAASAGASTLLQTQFAEITANTTKTGTAFATLLTLSVTVQAGSRLIIRAMGAVSNSSANVNMRLRLTVGGVSQGGVQLRSPATNTGTAFAAEKRTGVLTAGTYVINLEWAPLSGTMQCRPIANPDAESATLLVEEVTV